MTAAHGLVRGLAAAVRAAVVIRTRAFDALLVAPPNATRAAPRVDPAVARAAAGATRAAFVAIHVLRHVPGWRDTCLYRAVAECVVLRGLGLPATVRLGVRRTASPAHRESPAHPASASTAVAGAIAAHAWVECPGHVCRTTDGREADVFAPLRHPTRGSAAHRRPPRVSA